MIKGVFFDLYDTLIVTGEKTASRWVSEFYACLRGYGLSIPEEEFVTRCHGFFSKNEPERRDDGLTVYERRIKALCGGLGVEIDIEGIRRTAITTIETTNRNCCLDPECHAVLGTLYREKTLALITNYDHYPYIKILLRNFKLERYFSAVIVSEEAGIKKPDPGIFKLALEKTGLKPEEVIFVGDSVADDIAGAISAGITPVLIKRNIQEPDGVSRVFRDDFQSVQSSLPQNVRVIHKLSELLDICLAG
jgi:HAD superfamily hydrolase (TIGR01509 family)